MPTIGTFYGILIQMFFNDHALARPFRCCSMPGSASRGAA
jgi:hypothetical protein